MSKVELHISVTIIDCIEIFSAHELLKILLNNWALVDGCSLGSGGVNTNAITKSENVLESLVLQGVWVNVYNTFSVSNS
jgi:hypothetical protein